jgi:hypothetical protein
LLEKQNNRQQVNDTKQLKNLRGGIRRVYAAGAFFFEEMYSLHL